MDNNISLKFFDIIALSLVLGTSLILIKKANDNPKEIIAPTVVQKNSHLTVKNGDLVFDPTYFEVVAPAIH